MIVLLVQYSVFIGYLIYQYVGYIKDMLGSDKKQIYSFIAFILSMVLSFVTRFPYLVCEYVVILVNKGFKPTDRVGSIEIELNNISHVGSFLSKTLFYIGTILSLWRWLDLIIIYYNRKLHKCIRYFFLIFTLILTISYITTNFILLCNIMAK